MTDIALHVDQLPATLVAAAQAASRYMADAYAPATRAAYTADLAAWTAWCGASQFDRTITAAKVALWVASLADAGRKRATVDRAVASLSHWWRQEGGQRRPLTSDPVLARTLRGVRRRLGSAQKRARPVTPDELRAMVAAVGRMRLHPPGHAAWRVAHHRALLVVMFAAALRVGEALALQWSDLEFSDRGLMLTVRRGKTDQQGRGLQKAVPRGSHPDSCPVRALLDLRAAAPAAPAPLVFDASPRTVHDLLRRTAQLSGLDGWERVSTHSLRAGLATSAAAAGKPLDAIMRQTGHRSVQMVLRYVRPADLWRDNAAAGIGL